MPDVSEMRWRSVSISKPITGVIFTENRFGLWGFTTEHAPKLEAELV